MPTGIVEMRIARSAGIGLQSKPANLFAFDRNRYSDDWASTRP